MTGRHRGGRSLRWRLVVAVMAAAVGQGYAGRHRLAEAALGRPTTEQVQARPAVELMAVEPMPGLLSEPIRLLPTAKSTRTKLAVVPMAAAPDPLADTLPHPVVTLFPLVDVSPRTALAPTASAEDEVYAQVDGERDEAATAALAAGVDVDEYRGRHTA